MKHKYKVNNTSIVVAVSEYHALKQWMAGRRNYVLGKDLNGRWCLMDTFLWINQNVYAEEVQ